MDILTLDEARYVIAQTAEKADDFVNFNREQLIAYILLQDKAIMEAGAHAMATDNQELLTYLFVVSALQAELMHTIN